MEENEKLANLHAEHADWQNRIVHLKNEIKDMSDRLGSIVSKFEPRDVPAKVEHFQNQFILQKEVLDIMRHDFKQYENMIEDEQKNSSTPSADLLQMRTAYRQRLNDYDRILKDLKTKFEKFETIEVVSA